jgi:hypothetical protein
MRTATSITFVAVLLWGWLAWACDTCRPAVWAGIFNEHFWGRLALVLLPWAAMLLVVVGVHRWSDRARGLQ